MQSLFFHNVLLVDLSFKTLWQARWGHNSSEVASVGGGREHYRRLYLALSKLRRHVTRNHNFITVRTIRH